MCEVAGFAEGGRTFMGVGLKSRRMMGQDTGEMFMGSQLLGR